MKYHFRNVASAILCLILLFPALSALSSSAVAADAVNLSEGKTVVASSSWDDPEGYWRSAFLTDGSKLTPWPLPAGQTLGWRSGPYGSREAEVTLDLDLKQLAKTSCVELYPRGGGHMFPTDYSVSLSADGENWVEVAKVTGDEKIKDEGRIFEFTPTDARYVRITVTRLPNEKDGGSYVCTLSEIIVYGTEGKEVVDMSLNKTALFIYTGESETVKPTFEGLKTDPVLEFSSEDKSVAVVDGNGVITAKKKGETRIAVTEKTSGITEYCRVVTGQRESRQDNILIDVPVWAYDPALTEEQFIWLRDADIDTVMAVGHNNTIEHTQKMLEIAQKIWDNNRERNLKVFVHTYLDGITPAASDEQIADYAEKWRGTLAFAGYHIEDEPWDPMPYARIERILKSNDPDSIADINFLPGFVYGTYENYYQQLSDYAKTVGDKKSYLSFDNYPFGVEAGSVSEKDLFGNFETVRRAGIENDIPTAFYLQAVGTTTYGYRRPGEGELRYHIASALSYGFKWIKYFSWYVPGASGTTENEAFTDAIMTRDGQKTELYDVAAKLNKEVHNVGDVLVRLNSKEVYHTGKKSKATDTYSKLPSDFFVQPTGEEYAIVSLFEDPNDGRYYLMIVNKDFEKSAVMSFHLSGVEALREIDKETADGELEPYYKNGVLTRTYKPGEFALYRLSLSDDGYGSKKDVKSDNILIGAKSTVSSSTPGDGYCAAYSHDGVMLSKKNNMGWLVSSDGDHTEASILFDLGEVKEMNRLDVYPSGIGSSSGSYFPSHITLEVSDDGTAFKKVLDKDGIKRPTYDTPSFVFGKASGRYVKITVSSDTDVVSVSEFALYNDDGSIAAPLKTKYEAPANYYGKNVARDKRVTASDSYLDNAWNPKFAVDGVKMASWPTDKTLGWCSGFFKEREVSNLKITVDLDNVYQIDRIKLYPRGNQGMCFPSDYTVSVSEDGRSWTEVFKAEGDENKGEQKRDIVFDAVNARYVRVSVTKLGPETDVGGVYAAEISEIEVYAAEKNNVPETDTETSAEPDTEPDTETSSETDTESRTETSADVSDETSEQTDPGKKRSVSPAVIAIIAAAACAVVGAAVAAGVVISKKSK